MLVNSCDGNYREDLENSSDRSIAIASSLATILQKTFIVKSPNSTSLVERCPTFVAKEKSIKPKFLSKNKKVLSPETLNYYYLSILKCLEKMN